MKFIKNKLFWITIFGIPIVVWFWTHYMNYIFGWSTGTTDGWLGFLATYYGAILGIYGIWYQLNRTFEHDREKDLIESRGKLILENVGTAGIGDKIYFRSSGNKDEDKKIIDKIEEIQGGGGYKICNASPNPLSVFYCKVTYLDKKMNFYSPVVKPYSSINFIIDDFSDLSSNKTDKCLDVKSKDNKNIELHIEITYITKANEKRMVVFDTKKNGSVPTSDESLENCDDYYSYIKADCSYMIFNGNKNKKSK